MEREHLLNLGYGNLVPIARIVAILNPASNPMRHLREEAKKNARLVDATQGKKTRSIIVTDSNHVILSAFATDTLGQRMESSKQSTESAAKE